MPNMEMGDFDPTTGVAKRGTSQGLPSNPEPPGVLPGEAQDDGGIVVSAMGTGYVRIVDTEKRGGWELDPFRAIDVGQRLIAMGTFQLQQKMIAIEGGGLVIEQKPKIDIVRGTLPRNIR